MAIDDLSTRTGACQSTTPPHNMYKCLDGALIPISKVNSNCFSFIYIYLYLYQVCDFIVDCKGGEDERSCGTCTFDESSTSTCGWKDISQGVIMWRRGSNGTLVDPAQGPGYDHTTYSSTGNYIYLTNGNGTSPNAPARLVTPVLHEASSTCTMEFWTYITGLSANQLNVTLLTGNQIERATVQRFHYMSMTNWTKMILEIGRVDVPFQLAFDSTRLTQWGFVAIDDVRIYNCNLPPIVTPNQCQTADRFLCTRGSCISKSRICDLTDDCGDHSDEKSTLCSSYQTCTFDSFCNWRHDNTTQFKWHLTQGPSPSDETGVCLELI